MSVDMIDIIMKNVLETNRVIEQTKCGKIWISTVEITSDLVKAFDKLLKNNKENIPFETMVFPMVKGHPDMSNPIKTERYDTEEEAIKGHKRLVKTYSKKEIK